METNDDEVGYGKPPKETQFSKGQIANPNGRPVGPITKFLREFGDATELTFSITRTDSKGTSKSEASLSTNGTKTINQAIAARLLQLAIAGDMKAIREVLNRTEGRVPQPLNIGGQNGENPLGVVQVFLPDNGRGDRRSDE
ncbi:DUF5681 domain-containing protein [Fibrella forsythiae]|uniref:DUF5681 domain-containing protein n=1 Tax=Fibrella forsythiae TaxID=2817061 RepID=A0ABS3JC23_9BACT|nr:DUF5681 domain-containing protein [Fibrella forsythiae]MBO0947541.1 hypothetical protein [Fibrella forsythiae]